MPSLMIESFDGEWEKEWFTYKPDDWARQTHKVSADQWKAPDGAQLALEEANKLVVTIDSHAAEVQLSGGDNWQEILLSTGDFRNVSGEALPGWNDIKQLRLGARETLQGPVNGENHKLELGASWQGGIPEFRNLRWIKSAGTELKIEEPVKERAQ